MKTYNDFYNEVQAEFVDGNNTLSSDLISNLTGLPRVDVKMEIGIEASIRFTQYLKTKGNQNDQL